MSNPITPSPHSGHVGPHGERRLQARAAVNCPARLRTPFSLSPVAGKLIDISHGGAAFICNQQLKSGDGYTLLLDPPATGAASLSVGVSVLQCLPVPNVQQQFRANLRFSAVTNALRAYVDQQHRRTA